MQSRFLSIYFLLVCVAWLATATLAEAQLFSWGSPSAPAKSETPPQRAMSAFSRWNPFAFSTNRAQRSYGTGDDEGRGGYRTLCVRLCDGYYFPISHRTTRSKMYRESKICEASCDCETRLYYLPSNSSDIAHMTDLSGLGYKNLENAFVYRSAWDSGCACRPVPWSVAEASRHQDYASLADEQNMTARGRAELVVVAPDVKPDGQSEGEARPLDMAVASVMGPAGSPVAKPSGAGSSASEPVTMVVLNAAADQEDASLVATHSLTPDVVASQNAVRQPPDAMAGSLEVPAPKAVKSQRRYARLQPRPKKQTSRGLFQF